MLISTGMVQTDAASTVDWERMQGALATTTDKAMYVLVIARTALCEKGMCGSCKLVHAAIENVFLPENGFQKRRFWKVICIC